MNIRSYRRNWLRLHSRYELLMFRIFRKQLRKSVKRIRFGQMDVSNYRILVDLNLQEDDVFKSYLLAYDKVGILYGNKVGRSINKEIKNFAPDSFAETFKSTLLTWLRENAGLRITSVRQTLVEYLIKEIEKGISEGLTIRQVAANMEKLVNSRNFYKWQALRIARTETTAAANYGATIAGFDSGVVLEKLWISSNDARTRQIEKGDEYDHMDMQGIKVDQDGLFNVQGDLLRFPGDPVGSASNIINCRCTVALVPKRDSNGRLVIGNS